MTGPTYPISDSIEFEGKTIAYKFERSHSTSSDYQIKIKTGDQSIRGYLYWKRYKFDSEYNKIEMIGETELQAELPKQPPAGKLQYFIRLFKDDKNIILPSDHAVVIRFKGDVPAWILIPHVLAMFFSMMLAARTAFECFNKEPRLKLFTYWTIGILFFGGLILGPLMQYYAFGELWTGIPFGHDLTDNKTLIAFIGWLIAFYMLKRSPNPKRWILFAAILMFIVYLIPHSVLGSELDYSKSMQEQIR
jgi:hypothetical protein